jgi:hypothetical protein
VVTLPCLAAGLGLFDGGWEARSSALQDSELECGRFSTKRSMLIDYVNDMSSSITRDVNNVTKKVIMMKMTVLVIDNLILYCLVNFCNVWSTLIIVTFGKLLQRMVNF